MYKNFDVISIPSTVLSSGGIDESSFTGMMVKPINNSGVGSLE